MATTIIITATIVGGDEGLFFGDFVAFTCAPTFE